MEITPTLADPRIVNSPWNNMFPGHVWLTCPLYLIGDQLAVNTQRMNDPHEIKYVELDFMENTSTPADACIVNSPWNKMFQVFFSFISSGTNTQWTRSV